MKRTSVRLSKETEKRLKVLTITTGISQSCFIREAITKYLKNFEDSSLTDEQLEEFKAENGNTVTTEGGIKNTSLDG